MGGDDMDRSGVPDLPESDDPPLVFEFALYRIGSGGSPSDGQGSPDKGDNRWILITGVGVLGVMIALGVYLIFGSITTDDGGIPQADGGVVAVTTLPASDTSAGTSPGPDGATGSPDPSGAEPATAWNYTVSKTADILTAPGFVTPDPVGTSYTGILLVTGRCDGDSCTYESTFDLERAFLDVREVGRRAAAMWEVDGPSWSVAMVAHVMLSDTAGIGTCVILMEEAWDLFVTERNFVDGRWVPSAFTGALSQGSSMDPSVSTAGAEVCGEWKAVDEWSVTGRVTPTP